VRLAEKKNSPGYILASAGWGRKSAAKIAAQYEADWLNQISDRTAFLKLGFALYDAKRYAEALAVFRRMEQAGAGAGVALVWQGHMLDLLGRREEAIAAYKRALVSNPLNQHSQYGLVLNAEYVKQRLQTPFSRVENRNED